MKDLLEMLPEHFREIPEVVELQNAFSKWANAMHEARDELFAQFDVKTATMKGLALWETALGIATDISRPFAFRRSRIESKLRGLGTTTMGMIANVAESFSNSEIEVVEYADEYRFDVVFTGTVGIPPNMDDLTAAIEEIKPAHLAFAYVYTYRTWGMVKHMTWGDAAAYTWEQLREGTL
ncbi:MAG: YmfQ family protein [Oscillospiraceae bacterium]|nr:YmfQ family protein [Oscillospiraceae bacterium]